MLNLIKSNRMKNLAQALCTVIGKGPDNPISSEFIGIQSRGMKQWLSQVIARHFGVCANVHFMFPRQMLEYIREQSCESQGAGLSELGLLNRDIMAWAVLDALMDKASEPASPDNRVLGPETYLEHDDTGTKAMALSRRIANVLDDYQVYRPDMLADWGRGGNQKFEDPHALWQAALWQDLIKKGMSLPDQMQACVADLESGAVNTMALPQRISLFGLSAIPPLFLNLFNQLGRNMDVFLFLLTPTYQFFFDLPSPQQQEKAALKDKAILELPEEGNPLLAALGQSSRETQGLLENFDYDEPMGDLFADPIAMPGSMDLNEKNPVDQGVTDMLRVIQSDILNLVWRGKGRADDPMAVSPDDNSLAVHACHSPMRESQVLKDLILDAFNNDSGLCPHDVVVMMPDIEAYAPFLEAVFSQSPRLPFTVSDRRRRSESLTLSAFLNILDMKEARLEKSKIMGLLSCPVIADKFGLTMGDQDLVSALFDAAGILWGKDGAHRQKILGQPYEHNSWTFGLNRLMAGFALPEASTVFINDVLPCDGFEGLEGEILGKCTHFIYSLFKALDLMDSPGTVQVWATRFRTIISDMLAKDLGNDGDMVVLLNALDDMEKEADQAGFDKQISFSAVRLALTAKLDVNISQGSFLSGGITFCNLMPMRSIPFKFVCLMGMDAQSFPRTGSSPGFDLIRQNPRLGDKQDRLEDCELFLEALLCARLRFIITYTGMRISDNSPVPVASPVAELIDTVENSFVFPQEFQWQLTHPLHPFSLVYFSDTHAPGYFSYSNAQCRICSSQSTRNNGTAAAAAAAAPPFCFRDPDGDNFLQQQDSEDIPVIGLADLIAFFRHPVKYYVTGTLGVVYPEPGQVPDEREPFRLSGLSLYQLGSLAVENCENCDLYPRVKAQGCLPFGKKGEQEWARINDLAEPVKHLAQNELPDGDPRILDLSLQTDACCITGRVTDVYDHGRAVAGFGRLNPARMLTQWIMHLAYSCVEDHPGITVMVGQDPKRRKPAVKFEFCAIEDKTRAQALLLDLAGYYLAGKARVFPFFTDLCFQLVLDLSSRDYDLSAPSLAKALNKCAGLWRNSFNSTGESFNRYTTLVFGQENPFSDPLALEYSGVLDAGLAVYRPMLEHLIL